MHTTPGEERMARQSVAAPLCQQTAFVHLLQVVAVTANEASTVEDALQRCLDQVCRQTGWPVGHAYRMADDGTGVLVPTALWHLDTPERFATFRQVTEAMRLAPGVGLPGRVLVSGKPAWIMDISQEPQAPRARHAQDSGLKAAFALPIWVGRDVAAVLEFFATHARPMRRYWTLWRTLGPSWDASLSARGRRRCAIRHRCSVSGSRNYSVSMRLPRWWRIRVSP